MKRLFWLGVGLAVGAIVVRQVTKAAHSHTPAGLASSARNSAAGLWESVLPQLGPWLADEAWLYVEAPLQRNIEPGADWRLHREGSTRETRHALYRRG